MQKVLKQSTAATLKIGPFLDDTYGKTPQTGLTIAQADVRLSKEGGNMAQKNDATSATHDEIGVYDVPVNATDTGTLGRLRVDIQKSGALPVWEYYTVVAANVYDALIGASDALQVDAIQVGGTVQTANDMAGDIDTILSRVIGTLATGTHNPQGGDAYARLGAPAGASVSADIAAVKVDSGNIETDTQDIQSRIPAGLVGGRMSSDAVAISGSTTAADNVEANIANLDASVQTVDTNVDTLITRVPAEVAQKAHLVNGSGDITPPANIGIWDALGDGSKAISGLNDITAAAVWDATEAITGSSLSFETIMARLYRFLFNKMNITDSSGAVALRNEADGGDIMTNTITDNDTTTVRTAASWTG